jgi:glycosyltransferase involved in cell wall biosynthesis
MTRLSIIVPVFNIEKYLSKCIESILSQEFSDFELIIVNDGSTDSSGLIATNFAKIDMRVKVINQVNGGLANARNTGINVSKGEFISFIDGDDYVHPEMYQIMISEILDKNADISVCGRFDVNGDKISERFNQNKVTVWDSSLAIRNLLLNNLIDSSVCDKIFKRYLFQEIRFPDGKINEDMFIIIKLIHKSLRIVHTGRSLYYYYHRNGSITMSPFTSKNMNALEAVDNTIKYLKSNEENFDAEIKYYKVTNLIYLLSRIVNTVNLKEYLEEYTKLKREIFVYFYFILFSKKISFRNKIFVLLILSNSYELIKKIYEKIRH